MREIVCSGKGNSAVISRFRLFRAQSWADVVGGETRIYEKYGKRQKHQQKKK
jgi:hypothetical protein